MKKHKHISFPLTIKNLVNLIHVSGMSLDDPKSNSIIAKARKTKKKGNVTNLLIHDLVSLLTLVVGVLLSAAVLLSVSYVLVCLFFKGSKAHWFKTLTTVICLFQLFNNR